MGFPHKGKIEDGLARYGASLVAVAIGLLLRQLITRYTGEQLATYITFYPVVVAVAFVAGFGPGILATAATLVVVGIWVLPAQDRLAALTVTGVVNQTCFAVMGLFVSALAEHYRRVRSQIAEQSAELCRTYGVLNGIVAGATDKIAALDADFRFSFFNDSYRREFRKVFGIDIELGMSLTDLLAQWPHDRDKVVALLRRAMNGESLSEEHAFDDESGNRAVYELHYCPIRDLRGEFVGAAQIARDVTQRRNAELSVQRERQRLKDVLEMLPVYVALRTDDYRVSFANRDFRERFGDLTNGRCYESILGRSEPCEDCGTNVIFRTGKPHRREWNSPDGRSYDVSDFPFQEESGTFLVMAVGIDTTDRKLAEYALRKANALLEQRVAERTEELRTSESLLRRAHELLEAVTTGTRVLIAAQDTDLRYTFFNKAYQQEVQRLTGKVLALGDSMVEVFAAMPEQQAVAVGLWSHILRGESVSQRIEFGAPGRHRRTYSVHHTPLRNAHGEVIGAGEVALDITDQLQAEQALAAAKAAAESANAAKSQFLANMSHELRTPMNAILGMTALVLREDLTPRARDCLQTVRQSADGLLILLNEILDLSRIEAGGMLLDLAPFDLHVMLDQVLKTFAVQAEDKGLTLAWHSADMPHQVIGDSSRLQQVLVNLIGNAIKFTFRGSIEVRVTVQSKDTKEVVLKFTVADTGIGITPSDQTRIFAPFVQLDASNTRQHGGTGLGLTIVHRLIDRMGGRIWIDSQPGAGTQFHFTAPLRLPSEGQQYDSRVIPTASVTLSPIPARPLRVLLVEDTPANQKLATFVLSQRGHNVTLATNGREALDFVQQQPFDAVLMDVQMPVMDGLQATRAIRELPDLKMATLPIIALTAHALKGDADRCLSAGMDGYISKPISAEELLCLVERLADAPLVQPASR